ncbi:MAG: DUF362 domain-containing protein [Acidobacteriota bacterium]
MKIITRRDFLYNATLAALFSLSGLSSIKKSKAEATKKTKVVLVRDENALERKRLNQKVIQRMFDDGIAALLGEKDPIKAWKLLIKPDDVVGIKSNVWSPLPTPKEIEQAIKNRILDAGVQEKHISIDDRGVLNNPIFKKSTVLINVRPLRTHHWSGVGGCIKNYIMFVPFPFLYHNNSCANLGAIWNSSRVKGKTKLNILVILTPLFHGIGPHHFNPEYVWEYKGIILGKDPVSVDSTGVRILQAKRLSFFKKVRPISPLPTHIIIADKKFKLGPSDPEQIDLIKIGWMEDCLI